MFFINSLDKRIFFIYFFFVYRSVISSDFFVTKRIEFEDQQFFIADPNFIVYSTRIAFFTYLIFFLYFRGLVFRLPFIKRFLFKMEWKFFRLIISFSGFCFIWSFIFCFEDRNKVLISYAIKSENMVNTWEFSFFFNHSRGNRKDVFRSLFIIHTFIFIYCFAEFRVWTTPKGLWPLGMQINYISSANEYCLLRIFIRFLVFLFTLYFFFGEFIYYDIIRFGSSFFFIEFIIFSITILRIINRRKIL